jgi:hypothetical protein
MKNNSYVWLRRLITWDFIVLFAFYLGFRVGENAAKCEKQNVQMQQSK